MILILGVLALAILFYYYIVKPFSYWREKGVIQGRPIWVLGDLWKTVIRLESPCDTVTNIYKRFPGKRYAGVYQFFLPTLMIKDPELIKQITIKDFDHFVDHRDFLPADIDPLWGKNLLALQGNDWRDMRNLLSPSFTNNKLKAMFSLISECAENLINHYRKSNQQVIAFDVKDLFTRITNDIIASTSYGVKVDSLDQPDNTFYAMGKKLAAFAEIKASLELFGTLLSKNLYKIVKLSLFSKEVRSYFQNLIDESVKVREEHNIKRPDMITLLLEARKGEKKSEKFGKNGTTKTDSPKGRTFASITNEDIASQAVIFFFGGYDSVSSLMSFTAYELAVNKEIQDRLRQEVLETQKESDNGEVTFDGIMKMKYMDMVVSEALRKWPNFVFTDRICNKDYMIDPVTPDEKPLLLKKGSALLLPIYGIHHDPKYYPNPEKFDPERFNEENKSKINPYTYFSFGLGPRMCIGARLTMIETKVVMFKLLSNFEIVPIKGTDIPVKVSKKTFNVQPDGLKLGLKPIKNI